jgi:hypothetical protein
VITASPGRTRAGTDPVHTPELTVLTDTGACMSKPRRRRKVGSKKRKARRDRRKR